MGISILSQQSGIGHEVSQGIKALDPEFPCDWALSLVESQSNDWWELKLIAPDGTRLPVHNIEPKMQNAQGVQGALRDLRDSASAGRW
jgi:hypothetical protein